MAGLVLIISILAAAIWCLRKKKCFCCKRNATVIEKNEMYGAPKDYYEYDKDAYNTKVVDNNDYYYEE